MGFYMTFKMVVIISLIITALLCNCVSAISANARIVPTFGYSPLTVMFTDLSKGTPMEWHWDLGDGSFGSAPQFMHTYMNPGVYSVKLTVFDYEGKSDTITFDKVITVSANPKIPGVMLKSPSLSADFTATPLIGNNPVMVNFTDLSKGEPTFWDWDFGDDSNSSDKNPSHIYTDPGTYSVMLKITKEGSKSQKSVMNYITVYPLTKNSEGQDINSTDNLTKP